MKKKKVSKKKKKVQYKLEKNIGNILVFILLYFAILLCHINLLPTIYNIIIIVILAIIVMTLVFFLRNIRVKDSIKKRSLILAIILIIIFLFVDIKIFKTLNFWSKISSNDDEILNYSVLVLSSSETTKIKQLDNLSVGYYYADEKANDKLKIKASLISYDDINKLYLALFSDKLSAIIIDNSLKELAEENNENYSSKTKTIYTFSIKEKSSTVVKNVEVTEKTFNVYLSGIDTFGEIASTSRSDVNIVITVNPNAQKILLTVIPRDYYVKLHSKIGYRDKLTHAGIYGVDESIATIEDLLDIDINYYVKVNFTSVIDIVDTLGGITVYSENTFTSVDGYKFKKGQNTLDGEKALAFVRERYAFNDGDRQRGRNQEEVIKALVSKVTSPIILFKYDALLSKLSNKVETNIPQKDILSLVKMQLAKNIEWQVETNNLDGPNSLEYTYTYPNQKLYVMMPNTNNLDKVKAKIKEFSGD